MRLAKPIVSYGVATKKIELVLYFELLFFHFVLVPILKSCFSLPKHNNNYVAGVYREKEARNKVCHQLSLYINLGR